MNGNLRDRDRHAGRGATIRLAPFAVALFMASMAAIGRGTAGGSQDDAPSQSLPDGRSKTLQSQATAGKLLRFDEGFVTDVAFTPDGAILAAGYGSGPERGGGVMLWDVATRERVVEKGLPVAEGAITSVAFSPDGRKLAAAFGYQHYHYTECGVIVWDLAARQRLFEARLPSKEGWICTVAVSADGKTLAAGYNLGRRVGAGVVFWDLAGRRVIAEKSRSLTEGVLTDVAFSPRGSLVVAGMARAADPHDGGVALWDLEVRGRLAHATLRVPEGEVDSVAFSPDGERLAAAYDLRGGGVVLWDLTSRKRLMHDRLTVRKGAVLRAAFSGDGKTLVGAHAGESIVRVASWDLAARTRLKELTLPVPYGRVLRLAFSPDGKSLAAGFQFEHGLQRGGGVLLWDISVGPAVPNRASTGRE